MRFLLLWSSRLKQFAVRSLWLGSKCRMAHITHVDRCVGCRVNLLTLANLSALEMSIAHIIKRYTNVLTYFTLHDVIDTTMFENSLILL